MQMDGNDVVGRIVSKRHAITHVGTEVQPLDLNPIRESWRAGFRQGKGGLTRTMRSHLRVGYDLIPTEKGLIRGLACGLLGKGKLRVIQLVARLCRRYESDMLGPKIIR